MRDWKRYVRERLPSGTFRGESAAEILEEIADHLEEVYLEARRRGATEANAEAEALAEVEDWDRLASGIARARREVSPSAAEEKLEAVESALRKRGRRWLGAAEWLEELRHSVRRLRRAPGFTAVVLLTLGVGIGATTAVFSVVKNVLLDPLPYDAADRLVAVWNAAPGNGEDQLPQSLSINAIYEDEARVFQDVGVWIPQSIGVLTGGVPEELSAIAVTDGTLRALRVQPVLGRLFDGQDVGSASAGTVILSWRYWQDRMGGDPDVVGKTIAIQQSPNEIIGVLPRGFRFMDRGPDLYLPLRYDRTRLTVTSFVFNSLARLRDGVSIDEALADMTRLIPLAPERYPGGMTAEKLREIGARPVVHPLRQDLVGGVGNILWLVLGGVAIILLVASANVANLLLVRAEGDGQAVAIQSALGASRCRLVGRFLTESTTLGALGGVLGVGLALGGIQLLKAVGPAELPRLQEITPDLAALAFAAVSSVVVGLAVGLFPLARTWSRDVASVLQENRRGISIGRSRNRVRNTLVVAQLALALVLLVGSGLMIRSFISLSRVAPGYRDPGELLTFQLTLGRNEVPGWEDVAGAFERLAGRLSEIPGVESVGLSSSVPMDGRGGFDPVFVEDFPLAEGQQAPIRRFKWIGGGYHDAIGNPVIAGRPVTWDDLRQRSRVVMITEGMARQYWGSPARAIGRRIATGFAPGDWREIIGVVGDVRDDGLEKDPVDIVYWPMVMETYWPEINGDSPFVSRSESFVVRSSRVGTPGFLDEVEDVVRAAYPTRPLAGIRTMESLQRDSMARTSFTLVMLGLAAALAMLLGAIGIYGVVSWAVGQRTHEMGIRMAMGAEPGTVVALVLRQGMVLATIGVAVGLCIAGVATRLMRTVLFGVSPLDPPTFAFVAVVLAAIALLATWIPARRAARVDPATALRVDGC